MTTPSYTLSDFDFALPPELIAQHPAPERSASRLLDGTVEPPVDRVFRELPSLLEPGDLLVFNDTKVIKARLFGRKATGGAVEALVERVLPGTTEVWAHLRASKSPKAGALVRFADAFDAEVLGRCGPDDELFHLRLPADPFTLLERYGHVSWERVCSGMGLENIYEFLSGKAADPARVALLADAGDPVGLQAFEMFVDIYGAEAGNMALGVLARGGVYLAGGIAAKNIKFFTDGRFVAAFLRKGRFKEMLREMPIDLITDEMVGLRGAAEMARRLASF